MQHIHPGKGQGHAHQPQHAAVQEHQEQGVAAGPQGGHEDDVEQPEGHPDGEHPHHGHCRCGHRGIPQAEQRHHGPGKQRDERGHEHRQPAGHGEQPADAAPGALQILPAQLLAHHQPHGVVHALHRHVEEAAHSVADLIDLQGGAAQQAVGLHIHGVAQAEQGLVGDEGEHPADDGEEEGQVPAGQLPEGAQEGLPGDGRIDNVGQRAAAVGDDGGQGRSGHAHLGQAGFAEDQQIVESRIDDIDAEADIHRHPGLVDGPVHEGKGADDGIEHIAPAGDAHILPAQGGDALFSAGVKAQNGVAAQLRHREKHQKVEKIHQKLKAEAFFQTFPVPGTEKLGGIDVDARVDAEGDRAQQVVQLGGHRHRADASGAAHHNGVHKAGALVQDLLQGQGQGDVRDLLIKRLWGDTGFFPIR